MRVLSRQEMLLFRCGMLPMAEHIDVPLDQTGGTMDPESDAVMRLLAADDYPSVRRAVALNECAPADALRSLAFDSVTDVRAGAVSNPAIPEDVLRLIVMRALTSGVETPIRASAAANPSAPADILQMLASDDDERVRNAVSANLTRGNDSSSLPTDHGYEEASHGESAPVDDITLSSERLSHSSLNTNGGGERVAANPATPVDVLQSLANNWNPLIRAAVARNPSTPVAVRLAMATDADARVREQVAANIVDPPMVANPDAAEGSGSRDLSMNGGKESSRRLRTPSLELPEG